MTVEDPEQFELPPPAAHVAAHRRRSMIFLALGSAAMGFAIMVQMGLNENFVVEELGVSGFQKGLLESIRESCGIISLGILAILAGFAEPLIAAGAMVVFGVGLAGYAFVPDYGWLIVASLVWSQGLHVWMPLPDSMVLAVAEPGRTGHRMGQVRSAGAIGSALGLLAAWALTSAKVPIRPVYLLGGAMALLGAGAYLGVPRGIKSPRPRLVFRRRYGLFYTLSFLEGLRKQVFVAFAGFLLVKNYGAPLDHILLLWITVQAVSWLTAPFVGRLIDAVGERVILVFYFAGLAPMFCGYAVLDDRNWLYALFIIDNAFFTLERV